LKDYTIAVEATWYLQNLLDAKPVKEPLLSAHGGQPLWLKNEIQDDLDLWERHGLTPLFIFDGLPIVGKEEMSLRVAKEAAIRSEHAWNLYAPAKTQEQTTAAVNAFGNTGEQSEYMRHLMKLILINLRCNSTKDTLSPLPRDSP
jgi:hypothetical protein